MEILELWHNNQESWIQSSHFEIGDDDQLIDPCYSMISQGTERRMITGQINGNLAERMKVPYMKGHFSKNFTYGYSMVGRLINSPETMVHLMCPHQTPVYARAKDYTSLPENFDPKLGTLISNMETAVNAVWDAEIELGDKVLVIGFGIIGALTSLILARCVGVDLDVVEKDAHRRATACRMGLNATEHINYSEYDVVINAAGNKQALNDATKSVRKEGKIIELSWYGNEGVLLDLGDDFHHKRLRIISSQVSTIPYKKQPTWDFRKRKQLVIKLLQEINPVELIETEVDFNDTPGFYQQLRIASPPAIGIIIKY